MNTGAQTITGWRAIRKTDVDVEGTVLTSPSYTVEGWLQAIVPDPCWLPWWRMERSRIPTTVTAARRSSTSPIGAPAPGITPTGSTTNSISKRSHPGTRVELQFDGINDTAETYLNGQKLESTATGMFVRRGFDVTAFVRPAKTSLPSWCTRPIHLASPMATAERMMIETSARAWLHVTRSAGTG